MNDEKKLKQAQAVYDLLCKLLDEKEVAYEKHPDKLVVNFTMVGEDLPISIVAAIDADSAIFRVISKLPFEFSKEKRVEGAIAVCQANDSLVYGNFDYDFNKGMLYYKNSSSFIDSLISRELLDYMIAVSLVTIDEYNDKFFMLNRGLITLEDFIKMCES